MAEEYLYKGQIRNRLVVTFVLFVTLFVGSTGWFLYRSAKNSLDEELGGKLIAIAQTVATQVDGLFVIQLSAGDENTLTYANIFNRLNNVKEATKVKRVYIFNRENRSLVDTDESFAVGAEYVKLKFDKSELKSLWNGKSVYTVLFKGSDNAFYKSGYAPIWVNGEIVAAVGVDTSATFMHAIRAFGRNAIIFAIGSVLITIIIGFVFAKTITRPIARLVKAAEEIGKGNFDYEVKINSKDEIGYLEKSMETMRKGIIERDNRMMMMLAGIAHEIRNPLGGIELFAGLLEEDLEGDSKEHVRKIIKEVRHLDEIVTQFLEYARPAEPVKEKVQLGSLIDDVMFLLAPEFQKRGVNFILDYDFDTNFYVDPNQIKRAFMNIFKNALQVMSNGGELKLKCKTNGGLVIVSINNNGPIILAEDIEKIFNPFFTTKERGVGLGLSIVKKLVDDNGGNISVESGKEGTTFTVILPGGKD